MLAQLIWAAFFWPPIYITGQVLYQFAIILLLMIVYRIWATLLVLWLPVRNWYRRRQLLEVEASQLVLITGATSGIGLALAKHLHKLGYSVVAAYYNSNEAGYEELKRISVKQQRMYLVELDVRKQDSISQCYKQVEEILKQNKSMNLYALVNNAGLGSLQPFAWLQRKTISNLIETNLMGNLLMTREFLPLLASASSAASQTSSRLIFVSSGLGFVPGATYATYGLTKAAQIYLTKCLNLELKQRYRIQSVAVIPHNFIKNTNICALNAKNNQLAWEELRSLERQLYEGQFKEQCILSKSLEEATRAHAKKQASPATKASKSAGLLSRLPKLFKQVGESLTGENSAASIEESGALEGFELALRLRNPPEFVFAGDTAFQLLIGSLLLLLPSSFTGLLSPSVSPSLYK